LHISLPEIQKTSKKHFDHFSNHYQNKNMKKKVWDYYTRERIFPGATKILLKMKLTLIIILFSFLGTIASETYSQTQRLSLQLKNETVESVLGTIEEKSEYYFLYSAEIIDVDKKVNINVLNSPVEKILDLLFEGTDIIYTIKGRQVILSSVKNPVVAQQQKALSGKVTDSSGAPLPGVTVVVTGTSVGVITDVNGGYSLPNIPDNATLVFSFVGMKAQEIAVSGKSVINVTLREEIVGIDEVVAIGYGVQKKRDITGAITSVNSTMIEGTPVKDVMSVLQGRASGVQVVSNSGAPGDGITVTVRGYSTLNSGNSPLYVIDGVPVESNSLSQLNGWEEHGLNPLADINPQDIESIEVLKDGASTSIYGSRAANGVILITTKRGKSGQGKVSVNMQAGVSTITRFLSVLNARQYRDIITDAYENYNDYIGYKYYKNYDYNYNLIDSLNPLNTGDVDWQDVMYRTAWQKELNVSFSGGSADAKYAISSSYLDQDGIFIASNYKRITSRVNADFKLNPKVNVGYSVSYAHSKNNRINAGGTGNNSLVQSILVRPPTYSLTYPDGSSLNYLNGKRNPVALAKEVTHLNTTNRIIGNQYMEWEVLKGLKFRANLNVDYISMKEDEFYPTTVDYREGYNSGSVRAINNLTWANEDYLSYDKTFKEDHHFTALAGFSMQEWKKEITGLDGLYFVSDNITTLNSASTISQKDDYVNTTVEHSMVSFFGRLGYNYKGKYMLQANMRADGSSRFGKENRFGYFPSVSGAWRFTDEPFAEGITSILNDGKLRLSWGQTGNEAIGDYTSQGEFSVGSNYVDYSAASPTVMPNNALTWETTTQYDLGVDLSFLKDRFVFNADFYIKETTDLLFDVPIPETTGFNYITQNVGDIRNKGCEFALTSHNLDRKFKWTTSFNISFNRNKVVSLPEDLLTNGYMENGAYHILQEGRPIGVFYGYKFLGVFSRDEDNVNEVRFGSASGAIFKGGDPIWDDLKADNIIDDNDRQIIGDAQPEFTGGFNNDFSYKNFTLNVFFQFVYGNDIYSVLNGQRNWVYAYNNTSTDALNRWREQGDVTNYPRPIRNDPLHSGYYYRVSDRWIEDGSYLRLKNVSLAYNVPRKITEKLKISNLKAYVTGQNLITWTHYTGYDPEVSSYSGTKIGVDEGSYPQSRTIIFGVNIDF
jgi:TonB-linked SusC/RagA family outer membrane protein